MQLPSIVRRTFDPVTERIPVPIIGGQNAGRWWGLASAGSGYASGRRAAKQMDLLAALIRSGDVVWDVGAHHGYVSLMAERRVGANGAVHAFEPSAANHRILTRHLRWNRCANTSAHAIALGRSESEMRFGGGLTSKMHALGQGEETVQVRRADSMLANGRCRLPTFLKVDVEGAEGEFLEGCGTMLPPNARLVIAVHSADADRTCEAWVAAHDFTAIPSNELVEARAAAHTGRWRGDPDLYLVGPAGDVAAVRQLLA